MVEKVQRPLLGSIFTVAIIVMIIFLAFIWGRVILIKNVDTEKVNTMVFNLEEVDKAVRRCVDTKTTQVVDIDLSQIRMDITQDDIFGYDVVRMQTKTVTPVLSFVAWIPVNSRKIPYNTDRFIQHLKPSESTITCFAGMEGQVKSASLMMYDREYTAYVKDTGSEECPFYVCLKNDLSVINCGANCGCETDVVSDRDINFLVSYVGEEVIEFGGRLREREGIVGQDISGVILGRAERVGEENMNTMYLVYRTMLDGESRSRIVLNCAGNCEAYGGLKKVRISFASSLEEEGITTYNILLSVGD